MECGKPVCSILFDVQIAFDSVLHSSLVEKMQTFGLNTYQYQLRWICDYLIEREQCVVLNGLPPDCNMSTSAWSTPGSVLGPFLFTLYINELADLQLTEGSKVVGYADDLLLHVQTY